MNPKHLENLRELLANLETDLAVATDSARWYHEGHRDSLRWAIEQIESLPPVEGLPVDSGGVGGLSQTDDDVLAYVFNVCPCKIGDDTLHRNANTVINLIHRGFLEVIGKYVWITEAGIKAGRYAPR